MDNFKYELTETGGIIRVPATEVMSEGSEKFRTHIQTQLKAAAEEVGKTKATLSQSFDIDRNEFVVEWVWAE